MWKGPQLDASAFVAGGRARRRGHGIIGIGETLSFDHRS